VARQAGVFFSKKSKSRLQNALPEKEKEIESFSFQKKRKLESFLKKVPDFRQRIRPSP